MFCHVNKKEKDQLFQDHIYHPLKLVPIFIRPLSVTVDFCGQIMTLNRECLLTLRSNLGEHRSLFFFPLRRRIVLKIVF